MRPQLKRNPLGVTALSLKLRDITFLFGAGASFGAGGILPEPPPLGAHLYPILERLYPHSWGSLPVDAKTAFATGNFETGMAIVHERYGMAIPQLMREMAVYFVQFRPFEDRTLYCRLLRDLAARGILERVAFGTLNYDCVLEFSLLEQHVPLNYFEKQDDDRLPVWKLHGSCNFFAHGIQAGQGVAYGTGVTWEGGVQAFLDSNRVIEHCLVETGLAPVMALYMAGKPLNVSPSAIKAIQNYWASSVDHARAVVCVGARPWPADTHVWEPLAATTADLLFIGSATDFDSWRAAARSSKSEYLGDRFDAGYRLLIERLGQL